MSQQAATSETGDTARPPADSLPRAILFFLFFAALGLLGNACSLSIFFGVEFIFGSIAFFLALHLGRPRVAVLVALGAGAYTVFLWGHPYAMLIFFLEGVFIATAYGKKRRNTVALDALYWFFLGAPLSLVLYHYTLDLPFQTALLIALKQSINGIANSLLAYILQIGIFYLSARSPEGERQLQFQNILFIILLSVIFFPMLFGTVWLGRNRFGELVSEAGGSLERSAGKSRVSVDLWLQEKMEHVQGLARQCADLQPEQQKEMQYLTRTITRSDLDFINMYVADESATTVAFFPPLNSRGESTIGLSFADRPYFQTLQATAKPVVSDVFQGRGGVFFPIVTLSAPILRKKRFSGFALGALKATHLSTLIKKLEAQGAYQLYLTDRKKRVIATTDDRFKVLEHLDPQKHWVLDPDPLLGETRWGFHREDINKPIMQRWSNAELVHELEIPACRWQLLVVSSARGTIQQLYLFYIGALVVTYVAAILAVGFSFLVSHQLGASLRRLNAVAESLPKTFETGAALDWPRSRINEVQRLSNSFQTMSEKLRELFVSLRRNRDELEQRVEDRTDELSRANLQLREEVDKRTAIQEMLLLHDRAIESADEGVVISDIRTGGIIFANAAFERITGYTMKEIEGKNCRFLQGKDTSETARDRLREAIQTGQSVALEILNYRKNGEPFWNSLSLAPVQNEGGHLTHYVGILQDVTPRVETEQALREAKEHAESANQAKTTFLSAMSHEIRTPMNHILNMARFLQKSPLNRKQRKFAGILTRSSEHLLNLLNDILDLSKIESGALDIESIPFDLNNLLDSVTDPMPARCTEKGIEWALNKASSLPRVLRGDPTRIRQILYNLLGNALKFTASGSIVLEVGGRRSGDEVFHLALTVIDTGVGIPDDRKDEIFERFKQVDESTTRQHGGTGLGLAICQELVRAMGGGIAVSDNPGGGSRFSVHLPLPAVPVASRVVEVTDTHTVPGSARTETVRILLADDDETNQLVLREMLRDVDCQLSTVLNGREAVDAFRANSYDLVLMDIHMPVMDGYDATRAIRRFETEEKKEPTPILALTALAFQEELLPCLDAGMDDRLVKPLQKETLLEAIQRYVGTIQKQRTAPEQSSPTWPATKVINPQKGLSHCAGSREGYCSALRTFAATHGDTVSRLTDPKADNGEKRLLAHRLRGAAGIVGAEEIQARAHDLESAYEKGKDPGPSRLEHLASLLQTAEEEVNRLSEVLGANREMNADPSAPSMEAGAAFQALKEALKENRLSLEPALSSVLAATETMADPSLRPDFQAAVESLRFDEAADLLRQLEEIWKARNG